MSNSCLELANRLQTNGHHLWISSMKDEEDSVKKNGIGYLSINPIAFHYDTQISSTVGREEYYQSLIVGLDYNSLKRTLRSNQIDLVLVDMELHEYIIYLQSEGFPFMLLSQWFSIWQSGDTLPPTSTSHQISAIQRRILWGYSQIRGRIKTQLNVMKHRGITRRNFILYLSNELGFDTNELISYQFPLPFSYKSLPTLMMSHPVLELADPALSHAEYVYPMVRADRVEPRSEKFDSDYKDILSLAKQQNKKLILVTRSTMEKSRADILPMLLKTLGQFEDCISIVSLGKKYDLFKDSDVGSSVYLYQRIPQLAVLKEADLSINHGGIHTINECIHYRVPMLILSGGMYDQNGCATRVHRHGCGISLSPKSLDQKVLKQTIEKILSDPQFQNRIEVLHSTHIEAIESQVLENLINHRLQN